MRAGQSVKIFKAQTCRIPPPMSAMTIAERGAPSIMAISPKIIPAEKVASRRRALPDCGTNTLTPPLRQEKHLPRLVADVDDGFAGLDSFAAVETRRRS